MREKMDELLSDLRVRAPRPERPRTEDGPLTFWARRDIIQRYKNLQKLTRKDFGKKAMILLETFMKEAESQLGSRESRTA
jgi:hypothetical protein